MSGIYLPWLNYLNNKHYHEEWDEYNANEARNEERGAAAATSGNAEAERLQGLLDEMLWAVSGDEEMDPGADMTEAIKTAFRENANEYLALTPDSDFWEWAGQFADTSDGLDESEINQIINGIYLGDAWQEFGIDAANAMAGKIDELLGGANQTGAQRGFSDEAETNLKGLPGAVEKGAEAGTARALKNFTITLDGEVISRHVSQRIARDVQ